MYSTVAAASFTTASATGLRLVSSSSSSPSPSSSSCAVGRLSSRCRRADPPRCSYSEMEANASTAMYPLHRCKTIYLVRHAQGIHNVEGEKDHTAYMSPALLDAHLTPLGWNQVPDRLPLIYQECCIGANGRCNVLDPCSGAAVLDTSGMISFWDGIELPLVPVTMVDCLREHVKKCGLAKKIELVIASPLLRTMQTAVGVFGGENYSNGVSASQLMVEGAGHSGRQAISSLNCPPFLAVEACREHLGVHPCDKRRSITEYRSLFPAIDFSLIENDEDVLWEPDVREANESVAARGMKFIDWLWTREEKEIAIVSHSGFLYHTLNMYSKECHPTIRQEVGKHFANCELRSMVLVDRSMLGSDSPTCNFPGKIPAGLDLPSDVADEKHVEKASKN